MPCLRCYAIEAMAFSSIYAITRITPLHGYAPYAADTPMLLPARYASLLHLLDTLDAIIADDALRHSLRQYEYNS